MVDVDLGEVVEVIGVFIEAVGVAFIAVGGLYGLVAALFERNGESYFDVARRRFGRPLILGLEVLVAADIIETITVDRSLESVATLGLLVIIRVVLSFALDIEVDGVPPWRRAQLDTRTGQ